MRGQREDYDEWARLTQDARWSWEAVLPVFKKTENYYGGPSEYHGGGGEWRVERQRLKWAVLESFREAAQQAGIPRTEDFNRGDNTGVAYFDVNQRKGWRWNASKAFLRSVRHRRNLKVLTGAHVQRLLIERRRCNGVEFVCAGSRVRVRALCEVLLAAGSINSPQLLELSGIGDGSRLQRLGIPTLLDAPGVGANLQDHLQLRMPAGELGAAVGVSYRQTRYEFLNDTLTSQGVEFNDQAIGIYPSGDAAGEDTVKEFYGELLVPLLKDRTGAQALELELGARASDYDSTGNSTTWKALANWKPVGWMRVRGGLNRAERSPNIGELHLAPSQTFQVGAAGDLCSLANPSPFSANPANANGAQALALCTALMLWWTSPSSMSFSNSAPARANTSPSPVASITTRARNARRPALLSNSTALTRPSSTTGSAAQACSTTRTPVSSSISCVAILSRSGSIVGAQQTTPWKAEVLEPQYLASAGSREPQSAGAGPAFPSAGRRSRISSVKPRITWRPVQSVMRSIQMTSPPVERPPRWL